MNKELICKIQDFWFSDIQETKDYCDERSKLWFAKSEDTDAYIAQHFKACLKELERSPDSIDTNDPICVLCAIILIDQFSRNIYRDNKEMYELDHLALKLAKDGVKTGLDKKLHSIQRVFFYLPFEHSEEMEDQHESLKLYKLLVDESEGELKQVMENYLHYAKMHADIIEEFNRYPHRNKILGRVSTPEEEAFLKTPGSSF